MKYLRLVALHFVNKSILRVFIECSFLLCSSNALSMNLMDIYLIALQKDASILMARYSTIADQERVPQAMAQLRPNISIGITKNDNRLSNTAESFVMGEQITQSTYSSSNITLVAKQPIYRPYQLSQLDQARSQQRESELTLLQAEQNLVVRVTEAYFDVLFAEDQLALMMIQLSLLETQLESARRLFFAGIGIRTDVDEAQAYLDITRASEVEARHEVSFAKRKLSSIIGADIFSIAKIDIQKFKLYISHPIDVDNLFVFAESNSFFLKSIEAKLDVAKFEVEKAYSGHLPTLDAYVQLAKSDSENVTSINSHYKNVVLGIQASIPIYSGGGVSSGVRQSQANYNRIQSELQLSKRDVSLRVFKEYRGIVESISKINALETALFSADQLVRSARKSQVAGNRTIIDVLNAEKNKASAQRDLARGRYSYLISEIRLAALTGSATVAAVEKICSILEN